MTVEQYHRISEHLAACRTGPPPGRRFHACFGTGDHLMVFDVWVSQADFDKFGETLMPILAKIGLDPGQPQVMPIHNVVEG